MVKPHQQYLVVHQSRTQEPTEYENLLAEGIERSYAAGIHDLEGLAANLQALCVPAPAGQTWTAELFAAEMKRLGA
jgi:hypothetical protein